MAENNEEKDTQQDDAAVVELNGQSGAERDADFSVLDRQEAEQAELAKLKAALESEKDQHLRALADFDNFRKRAIKERSELLKYQGEKAFLDLLDIQDNLELALKHADADPATLKQGVALIHKLLLEFFKKWEIKSESAVGVQFDPARHNAISRVEAAQAAPGTVINELKKAYFYKDKLLRPAEVVVAGAQLAGEKSTESGEESAQRADKEE